MKDLLSICGDDDLEAIDNRILCPTILTAIFNISLSLDPDLIHNLVSFKKIYWSVLTIAENTLGIPMLEIIELLRNFNHKKTAFFLRQTELFPIIPTCFYNPFKKLKINFDQLANNFQHLDPDSIAVVTSPPLPTTTNAETQSCLPTNPLDIEYI